MLCGLQTFSFNVYHPEQPRVQSLFLFPIVFGIILFIFSMERAILDGASTYSIIGLESSITRRAI